MEYTVVNGYRSSSLYAEYEEREYYTNLFIEKINEMISEGWEPIGGICYTDGVLMQAMIKKES